MLIMSISFPLSHREIVSVTSIGDDDRVAWRIHVLTLTIQGCASVISVNLLFAGLLTLFFPRYASFFFFFLYFLVIVVPVLFAITPDGRADQASFLLTARLANPRSISETSALRPPGSLGLFSGLTLLAWVLVYFLVEETRQLSLEELYDVFSYPKGRFVQRKHHRLGYLARRYLLRDMGAKDPEAAGEGEDEGEEEYSPPRFASGGFAMAERRGSSVGAASRFRRDSPAASPRGSAEAHSREVPSERH